MYAVIDDDKIIAFHDEKRVVKCYIDHIYRQHNIRLKIVKIKKKHAQTLDKLYDLYLVRYGDTYIQSGYLSYLELADPQVEYDHQYAKDVLLKLLELEYISDKDQKILMKCIGILNQFILEDRRYTPDIHELERIKDHYQPYMYNLDKDVIY